MKIMLTRRITCPTLTILSIKNKVNLRMEKNLRMTRFHLIMFNPLQVLNMIRQSPPNSKSMRTICKINHILSLIINRVGTLRLQVAETLTRIIILREVAIIP